MHSSPGLNVERLSAKAGMPSTERPPTKNTYLCYQCVLSLLEPWFYLLFLQLTVSNTPVWCGDICHHFLNLNEGVYCHITDKESRGAVIW